MRSEIKSILANRSFLYHFLPAIIVFLSFMTITIWGYVSAKETLAREQQQEIRAREQRFLSDVEEQLSTYEEVLRGAVGLFAATEDVKREEWARYVSSFDAQGDYPGLVGIGYAEIVQSYNLSYHEEYMRSEVTGSYAIHPEGDRSVYIPVKYLEPLTEVTNGAVGFDLNSDKTRRKAMEKARDANDIIFTGAVQLKLHFDDKDNTGFVAFMPVYQDDAPTDTVEQRRQAIQGFVVAPFLAEGMLSGLDMAKSNNAGFSVYVNSVADENKLYQDPAYADIASNSNHLRHISEFKHNGAEWIVDYRYSPEIVSSIIRDRPLTVLVAGVLLSALTAGLILTLLIGRTRSLAYLKEREVQSAKDDLLSLASHQLRTPATGVKQYIAMVLEGYAGSLKEQQRMYLEKAYESNERQLHIINELLYVAKADAGRIVLAKRNLKVNELVKEVTEEQRRAAKDKDMSLRLKLPSKDRLIYGDKHCLRMAIENLISNAIKYTPNGGKVVVSTEFNEDETLITVKDTGVGISEQDKKLLFTRFSRIPNSMTTEVGGSGIGLYLAKRLVDLHKGDITVDSKPGKGTTFTVHLPNNSER